MTSVNSSPISKLSFHDSDEEDFGLTHKNENGVGAHTTNDDPDSEADYNTRMDEIFSDSGDSNVNNDSMDDAIGEEEEEEEEGFVYTGKDAEPPSGGYREQLRDVLDEEIDSEDDTYGPAIDSDTSAHDLNVSRDDYEGVHVVETPASELSSSNSSVPMSSVSPVRMVSPHPEGTQSREGRPYLHPSISRLRSHVPERQRVTSVSSFGTAQLTARELESPSPSYFSSISRTSSISNLRATRTPTPKHEGEQETFRWSSLRIISENLYRKTPDKANAVLGSPVMGSPTVLAVNGLICIGTDVGRVFVFDFKQQLRCICGDENSARNFGPVTALALSNDHTFVAVGHVNGHIQLFDFKHPHVAARTVLPISLTAVRSGRQEGHLIGSRIVALGFISGRHTAFASADDQGMAFYHSLGKVLFMEANDCLRILGKYPEEEPVPLPLPPKRVESSSGTETPSSMKTITPHSSYRQARKGNTILAMSPLPPGAVEHATDSYQLIAMLTPIKLVIVGLKPAPKTWFRRHRDGDGGTNTASRWRGCLVWYPSISTSETPPKVEKKTKKGSSLETSQPLLAFSWASTVTILRVAESRTSHTVRNEKTGKIQKIDVGKISFSEYGLHTSQDDILAIQWLNINQLILFTDTSLEVLDIPSLKIIECVIYNTLGLVSPTLGYTSTGAVTYQDSIRDIHHSIRTYKGKIFCLEYRDIKTGTLLSWADRILSYVQDGDFLSAINLARDYYTGQAKGNKNGLPEDIEALHALVGGKISDLMVASARYAFSEDRFTDGTHITEDNRGVDRTSLFEDLVATCARACIALDEFDFLFEELFQHYDDAGISRIYLRQLEPFVLDGSIHFIPPRITQRLVAMHDEDGKYEAAEKIIWHIDPDCLDIDQALGLCQKYQLYDALVYIYNTALRDYITPVVELINLVRKVQQRQRERYSRSSVSGSPISYNPFDEEQLTANAYKIYPYLSNTLSGLSYPSEIPIPSDDSIKAQSDVYSFLFHGRSRVWPPGNNGRLVLTADEEGGEEPTYPYARLLLRFDAEAFLHVLDIAFEQSYLNDETNGTSRQIIVKILLDIVSTSGPNLSPSDITFVHIFVARNVPKYPQFIHIAPSSMQNLLVGLASDPDEGTREDRQLAAEFLLSAYTPHDSDYILHLFEEARFYRILRSWYRQEENWAELFSTYVNDSETHPDDLFSNLEETLTQSVRSNKGTTPPEMILVINDATPRLLRSNIPQTALLLDKYVPENHGDILSSFEDDIPHKQYAYLRCLLGPPPSEEGLGYSRPGGPSISVDEKLRKLYLRLLCQLEPSNTIIGLEYLPREDMEMDEVVKICEEEGIYEAVVWLLNEESAVASLTKLEDFSNKLTVDLCQSILRSEDEPSIELDSVLKKLDNLYKMGIDICREHSQQTAEADVPVEDLWFKLLGSQIDAVQTISSNMIDDGNISPEEERILSTLRSMVHESFTNLVAISSTKALSFPRLFKRLVDSTVRSRSHTGTRYSEFRNILTSMLESYRSEGDLLLMSKRIIDNDYFDTLEGLTKARSSGWTAPLGKCPKCKKRVTVESHTPDINASSSSSPPAAPPPCPLVVSRSGVYHSACFTSISSTPILA